MNSEELTSNIEPKAMRALPVLPLKNMVILPKSIIPVIVGRAMSVAAVEAALQGDRSVFITAQKDQAVENPTEADLYACGTRSTILQVMRLPKGALKILVEGVVRAELHQIDTSETRFIQAQCSDRASTWSENDVELEATWRTARNLSAQYVQLHEKSGHEALAPCVSPDEMEQAIDTFIGQLSISLEERQKFLEITQLKKRISKFCSILEREISILEVEERIRGRIQTQVEKNQREYYLTEQIKAIQKELGRDEQQAEIGQLRTKLKALKLSEDVFEKVDKELKRLEQMPGSSAEASVVRHYVDWILALPWNKQSKDTISIEAAEKILDKKHAGLKKPKERIIEFIAARKFSANLRKSPIICLAGPPGVGKTSLAESIADSLGREFRRISLGGVRDEAEIRGHRRTYIGAQPGKLIQALRSVKTVNPVILLDEIDKMSSDAHGDPGAALLEVLDPEQNRYFTDHFLEVPYDLSQVMFITTANMLEGIPYPLHDRMEVIQLSGYTEEEKLHIATQFLIPKNLKEHGLTARQFKIDSALLKTIISEYTKEAGVRQLERIITKLIRKAIQEILKSTGKRQAVTVTEPLVRSWLGHARFKQRTREAGESRVGMAYGLAWTEVGGDVMDVETTIVPGKGNIMLTGQLGEVMQESAHAALSYIRSRARDFGLKSSFNGSKDIHIHVPEGATPKDGPSAGITMCVALVSELTGIATHPDVAMTGEITLHGRVLPVGGLKEKILAAQQFGIKTIIIPKENNEEVAEFSQEISRDIQLNFVNTMDEVLEIALVTSPAKAAQKTRKRTKSVRRKVSSRTSA